eukprot:COSAG02_NODE_1195_length_13940_cov_15.482407_9_plen_119_part_00
MTEGALGAIGIDFSKWTETTGLTTTDGAVFTVDPDNGATTLPCPLAILTVADGSTFSGRLNARGKSQTGEWEARGLEFSQDGGLKVQGVKDPHAEDDANAPAKPDATVKPDATTPKPP